MNSQLDDPYVALRRAIDRIWADLPALVGDDLWPDFEGRLQAYLARFDAMGAAQAPITRALILGLFGAHPAAHRRLLAALDPGREAQADYFAATRGLAERGPESAAAPPPAAVTRYTDITCPGQVWVETPRVAVTVRLTLRLVAESAAMETLELDLDLPVWVRAEAPGFAILEQREQPLTVPPHRNSAALVFYLRPLELGHTHVVLEFR